MINFSALNLLPLNNFKQEAAFALTQLQKKTATIALIALACLTFCYLFYRCCFSAKVGELGDEDDNGPHKPGSFFDPIISVFQKANQGVDDQVKELLEDAEALYDMDRYESARLKFKEALKIDPQNVHTLQQYGVFLACSTFYLGVAADSKYFLEAEDYFNQVLANDPKNIVCLIFNGKCLMVRDEIDKAIDSLEKALLLGPKNVFALLFHAEALLKKNKLFEAKEQIEKALLIARRSPRLRMVKGDILFALNDIPAADASYTESIQISARMRKLHIRLGELHHKGKHQAVLALKLCPSLMTKDYEAVKKFAKFLYDEGCFDDAEILFNQLIRYKHNDAFTLARSADILCQQGRFSEAIKLFTKAFRLDSKDQFILERFGYAYLQDNQLILAKKYFKKAIANDPNSAFAIKYFAFISSEEGNLDSALADFEKALKMVPEDVFTLNHYAEVLFKLEKYQEALNALEKVLQIDPQNAFASSFLIKTQDALKEI